MWKKEEKLPGTISDEQRQALIERILTSTHFARSPRLSAFLSYICEQDKLGHPHLINEQHIGVTVFSRPPGYNMSDDSIVRSQARFLRQRLEEYFTHEGSQETFLLFIPKGSYLPFFQSRAARTQSATTLSAGENSLPPVHLPEFLNRFSRQQRQLWTGVGLSLILLLVLALRGTSSHLLPASETNEQRFWNSLLDPKRTPLIVPSDSSLALLQELANRSIPLQDYMNRRYLSNPPSPELAGVWHTLSGSQYTNMADMNFAFRLEQLPAATNSHLHIRYARSLALKELKENNAILIGGRRSNPWVELYAPFMCTDVGYDQQQHENFVWNRNPAAGEQKRYYETTSDTLHMAYGLIARLSSLDGQGNTLLVGGTSEAGTEAAAEFLFSGSFSSFLRQFDCHKPLPYFEILLSTENINGEANTGKVVYFHILSY